MPAWLLPAAGLAMSGAGLGYGIWGGKGVETPNISGELAKITALIEQMKAAGRVDINNEAVAGRRTQSNNLATRGTYRSPVAQNVYNALEGERLKAIASMEGQLAGQEASLRAGFLDKLLGYNMAAQLDRRQRDAAIAASLSGFGGSLLNAYWQKPKQNQDSEIGQVNVPGVGVMSKGQLLGIGNVMRDFGYR
ncbi:MAG: hypothetical protein PHF00_10260 [Elusimicrobia bacterium]|nr:hypothetical protein [Elusimicrobiota bacterium]